MPETTVKLQGEISRIQMAAAKIVGMSHYSQTRCSNSIHQDRYQHHGGVDSLSGIQNEAMVPYHDVPYW